MRFRTVALVSSLSLALGFQSGCAQPTSPPLEIDRPSLVPENDLERAVLSFAASPTPENEIDLGRSLLTSTVYVRVESALTVQPPGSASTQINVWSVTLPDGRAAIAIYTSKSAFASAFREEPRANYIGLSGSAALELAATDQPIAINWGVDPHVVWDARLTRAFLAMP